LTCSNSTGNDLITKTDYISVFVTGIDRQVSGLINFYPNPTNGILYIETDRDFRINIITLTGKVLFDKKNQKEIDLTDCQPGLYILQLEIDGKVIKDKIIKQ
jgi:hypothetical protein